MFFFFDFNFLSYLKHILITIEVASMNDTADVVTIILAVGMILFQMKSFLFVRSASYMLECFSIGSTKINEKDYNGKPYHLNKFSGRLHQNLQKRMPEQK